MQRWPRPGVSPEESTDRVAILPSVSRVTVTFTSLSKPSTAAVSPSGSAAAGCSSSAGSSLAGAGAPLAAKAAASLMASMQALLVMVAFVTASMPSPRVKGAALPMNWFTKLASLPTLSPKYSVS